MLAALWRGEKTIHFCQTFPFSLKTENPILRKFQRLFHQRVQSHYYNETVDKMLGKIMRLSHCVKRQGQHFSV